MRLRLSMRVAVTVDVEIPEARIHAKARERQGLLPW